MNEDEIDMAYDEGRKEGIRATRALLMPELLRLRQFNADIFHIVGSAEAFGDEIEVDDIKEALRKVSQGESAQPR